MLTNDERAALREAHRLARWTVRRDVPLCETCEGPFPCSTVRLLDALDAETARADAAEDEVALLRDASLRYERAKRRGNYDRIGVDADGYAWRVSGDMWSMVRTTETNGPIPEPVTWYVPELDRDGWRDLFHQVKRANREARAALARVRALHAQEPGVILRCRTCGLGYPCATVRAISTPASPAVTHACPEHHRTDCGCDLSAIDGGAS